MHIGQRIQALMKAAGITTDVMAKHCGVTKGAVSNWFSTGTISKPNLAKAAKLLQVDLTELIEGEVGERGTTAPLVLTAEERAAVRAFVLTLRKTKAEAADLRPTQIGKQAQDDISTTSQGGKSSWEEVPPADQAPGQRHHLGKARDARQAKPPSLLRKKASKPAAKKARKPRGKPGAKS
jgi:transcriptional regulator with XRE-family HTH domain